VEYSDGTAGIWFLLLFPFLASAILRNSKQKVFLLSLLGSVGCIFVFAILGTYYIRYYIPSIAILSGLMTKGIPIRAAGSDGKFSPIWIPVIIIGLSFLLLSFRTVWSPTINHWKHFRSGSQLDWLETRQSGFTKLYEFLDKQPADLKVFSYNSFGNSHFPRNSVFLRTPDIVFSKLIDLKLSLSDTELLKNDFW